MTPNWRISLTSCLSAPSSNIHITVVCGYVGNKQCLSDFYDIWLKFALHLDGNLAKISGSAASILTLNKKTNKKPVHFQFDNVKGVYF